MALSPVQWWHADRVERCTMILSPVQWWHVGPNATVYYDMESCAMMTCWTERNGVLMTLRPVQWWHGGQGGTVWWCAEPGGTMCDDVEPFTMMTCWTGWNSVRWRWILCHDDTEDRVEQCTMTLNHVGLTLSHTMWRHVLMTLSLWRFCENREGARMGHPKRTDAILNGTDPLTSRIPTSKMWGVGLGAIFLLKTTRRI